MSIHLYQVIVVIVSVSMIFAGIKNYLSGKSGQNFYKISIRIVVWGGMSVIAIFPQITNTLASLIGLKGNINAVILSGFLLIFLMIFKLLSAIERLEQNISELTRKESLQKINNSVE